MNNTRGMEKVFIHNRKGQKMAVAVDENTNSKCLVFVMHGLGGFKESPQNAAKIEVFKELAFTVVSFDTTNTFGESDGKFENATFGNYYEDLEDVILWSKKQSWYKEPYVLSGASLGGFCSAYYAQNHPDEIFGLALVVPAISGKLFLEAFGKYKSLELEKWKKTGWRIWESKTKPGVIKRLPWSHMEDRLKYDLLPQARKLTMPVLLIVGEKDTTIPPEHPKKLFDLLPGRKEFHIIKNADHSFHNEGNLDDMQDIHRKWIPSLFLL